MTDIEKALAKALHDFGIDCAESAAIILATEPMQAIARVVDAAVEWVKAKEAWTSPDDNEACQRAAWALTEAVAALEEDR